MELTTIIKGVGEIVALLAILGFFASLEYRLRGKVGKDFCSDRGKALDRIESHLWDIMMKEKIEPTMDPPEEIKNNHRRKNGIEASD